MLRKVLELDRPGRVYDAVREGDGVAVTHVAGAGALHAARIAVVKSGKDTTVNIVDTFFLFL